MDAQARRDKFNGYGVRRWPAGTYAGEDASIGDLLFLEVNPEAAATIAWRLRALRADCSFGVIRMVGGERELLRADAASSTVSHTYIDLDNERRERFNALREQRDPGPVAA